MQMMGALAAVLLLALAGCQSPAPVAEPEPQRVEAPEPKPLLPAPVEPPPAPMPIPPRANALSRDGVGLYDAGNFNGAIKRLLGAKEIWDDSTTAGATRQQSGRAQVPRVQLLRDEPSHAVPKALRRRNQARRQLRPGAHRKDTSSVGPRVRAREETGERADRARETSGFVGGDANESTEDAVANRTREITVANLLDVPCWIQNYPSASRRFTGDYRYPNEANRNTPNRNRVANS